MAFVLVNAFVLVQLSMLLLGCFTVLGDEVYSVSWTQSPHLPPIYSPVEAPKPGKHHHPGHHRTRNQPPSHTPLQPPSHTPLPPPSHPPLQPPSHQAVQPPTHPPSYPVPTRKLVAVQGVVYCKSCKYTGIDTLWGASPLAGAIVRLQCNNTKYPLVVESKTDKNGYFFIMPQGDKKKLTTAGSHKCKVTIVSSPMATCNKPTDLHAGYKGAILMPSPKPPVSPSPSPHPPPPFQLFTVGPFAFEPLKRC